MTLQFAFANICEGICELQTRERATYNEQITKKAKINNKIHGQPKRSAILEK